MATLAEIVADQDAHLVYVAELGPPVAGKLIDVGGLPPLESIVFSGVNSFYWYNRSEYRSFTDWLTATTGTFGRALAKRVWGQNGPSTPLTPSYAAGSPAYEWTGNYPNAAELGLSIEGARTLVVVAHRNLTNAAWVKTNMSVVQGGGADGSLINGSRLSASAANATVLQAIALAASTRFQSAYVKRIGGSGPVQMTMDNGATWTTLTLPASSLDGWVRVSIPPQTLANPVVGFRIVTSGDSILVDFVQNEDSGVFASSATDTSPGTRPADVLARVRTSPAVMTKYLAGRTPPGVVTEQIMWSLDDGSANNRLRVTYKSDGHLHVIATAAGADVADLDMGAVALNTSFRLAFRAQANDFAATLNAGALVTDALGAMPAGMVNERYGAGLVAGQEWFSTIRQTVEYAAAATGTELKRLTGAPESTIYCGTRRFGTKSTDTPASQSIDGTLQSFEISRSIAREGDTFGIYAVLDGFAEIGNADKSRDWLSNMSFDGQPIKIKVGRVDHRGVLIDDYNGFQTLFTGTTKDAQFKKNSIRFLLRDNSYKLDVPAQPNNYAGTGGSEGDNDIAFKRKGRGFGDLKNITPTLVDATKLIYQANDGQVNSIAAVYDKAGAITFDSDQPDYASLEAAVITAGRFASCNALGFYRLQTAGSQITCDVQGDKLGGVYITRTPDIVRRVIATATTVADPADFDTDSWNAIVAASAPPAALAPVAVWLDENSTDSVADFAANMLRGIDGWIGFRPDTGKLEIGIFEPAAGVPDYSFTDIDIKLDKFEPTTLPADFLPPSYSAPVIWGRSWTVQTDVLPAATAAQRAFVSKPYRLGGFTDPSVKAVYANARAADPAQSYFTQKSGADSFGRARLSIYGRKRGYWAVGLKKKALGLRVGQVMQVTRDRFGFGAGKLLKVVSTRIAYDKSGLDVEALGYG